MNADFEALHDVSADCNGKLHSRFDTPSVLIVQNDGLQFD